MCFNDGKDKKNEKTLSSHYYQLIFMKSVYKPSYQNVGHYTN